MTADVAAHCTIHVDSAAVLACTRCGRFACGVCRVVRADGVELCAECARVAGRVPLPIDAALSPASVLRTTWRLLAHPLRTARLAELDAPWSGTAVLAASAVVGVIAAVAPWAGVHARWRLAPAPIQFVGDVAEWAVRRGPGIAGAALATFALDRLALTGRVRTRALARAWALSLAVLWLSWPFGALSLVGLAGGYALGFEVPPMLLALCLAAPLGVVVGTGAWFVLRWALLRGVGGRRGAVLAWASPTAVCGLLAAAALLG